MGRRATAFPSRPSSLSSLGWQGWDEYAPFYDWENARTLGRRDVPFWRRLALTARGPVLELGCGTGRVALPLARAGVDLVGVDRSAAMLSRAVADGARRRASSAKTARALRVVRGDIRSLPFHDGTFTMVLAPYGILQSLITTRDLTAALASAARVLCRGGTFGIDLVPDVANWREYTDHVRLRGRAGRARVTLVESVRRHRARGLTIFKEQFLVTRGRQTHRHSFDLVFRTLPPPEMTRRLRRAGFSIDVMLGDYRGGPWHRRAGEWIILAKKV
jgi:ubiquinone/menaquinone biosynthesis C-methylase UbiE